MVSCGIDFGTSNSTAAVVLPDRRVEMVRLEGEHVTLPSAVFVHGDAQPHDFGRTATAAFLDGADGRLLRSLKSVLGTSLIGEKTVVGRKRLAFEDVLASFVGHVKAQAEAQLGEAIETVVMGRPVHFVDGDAAADRFAEEKLADIARSAGFTTVDFQYEPIAAALAYEQDVLQEELALIADIGGGTSDFSVIRLGPKRRAQADRRADILANSGVRVGGTDLDKRLSVQAVMPLLGLGTEVLNEFSSTEKAMIPPHYFADLATWYKIHLLYTGKYLRDVRGILRNAVAPEKFARYVQVVEHQVGHDLAGRVEAAKIDLSCKNHVLIELAGLVDEAGLTARADVQGFELALLREREKIRLALTECLALAGVSAHEVGSVFLTGGTTAVPCVRQDICALAPHARVVEGDLFGSVGLGLGLQASRLR